MIRSLDHDRLIESLYAGVLDPVSWDRAVIGLADAVGATGAVLMARDPRSGSVLRADVHRFDPVIACAYQNGWDRRDIRIDHSLHMRPGEALYERRLLPLKTWRHSEVYNEFLRPADAPYFLAWHLHMAQEKVVGFALQLPRARGPCDDVDAAALAPLIPHLQRAVELKDRFESQQLQLATLHSIADRIDFGVLVLDTHGRVLEGNAEASRHLTPGGPLFRDEAGAVTARGAAGLELQGYWARGRPSERLRVDRPLLHLPRDNAAPVSLMLVDLSAVELTWIRAAPRWLVLLFDPERRISASSDAIARDLGLSLREAEVVARIVEGEDLKTVAVRLGVTMSTVRSHLKAAFAKTGISSQASLIRRVLAGPARLDETVRP